MFSSRTEKIKEKIISPDEKILLEFGIAKSYYHFWRILGLIVFLISLTSINDLFIFILLAISLIGYSFYLKSAYYYFLTDRKIIFYYQFFSSYSTSIDYQKTTDLNVRENFFEKTFLHSGNLAINTAGTPQEEIIFAHISDPHSRKRQINEIKSG